MACVLAWGGTANAQDTEAFLQAWQRAQRLEVRGAVESSVFFPPRDRATRRAPALPRVEFLPQLVRRNFDVQAFAPEPVAGRETVRYDLIPKNGAAGRWSVWLDAQWNVPLAFEERTPDGDLVRRAAFTRVDAPPQPRPPSRRAKPANAALKGALARALPGLELPARFEPVQARAHPRGPEVVLSDGVNVLALVVTTRPVRPAPGVAVRRVGKRYLWLVGNLPNGQLERALAGVQDVQPGALSDWGPDGEAP